jgi:hypothetical protein
VPGVCSQSRCTTRQGNLAHETPSTTHTHTIMHAQQHSLCLLLCLLLSSLDAFRLAPRLLSHVTHSTHTTHTTPTQLFGAMFAYPPTPEESKARVALQIKVSINVSMCINERTLLLVVCRMPYAICHMPYAIPSYCLLTSSLRQGQDSEQRAVPRRTQEGTHLLPRYAIHSMPYAIMPYCHMPYCHTAILPYCHTAILPYCHTAICHYAICHTAYELSVLWHMPYAVCHMPYAIPSYCLLTSYLPLLYLSLPLSTSLYLSTSLMASCNRLQCALHPAGRGHRRDRHRGQDHTDPEVSSSLYPYLSFCLLIQP